MAMGGLEQDTRTCSLSQETPHVWYKTMATNNNFQLTLCSEQKHEAREDIHATFFMGGFDGIWGHFGCHWQDEVAHGHFSRFEASCEMTLSRNHNRWDDIANDTCITYTWWSRSFYPPHEQLDYKIAVHGEGTKNFSISLLELLPPVNDNCSGALELLPGSNNQQGTTVNSTPKEGECNEGDVIWSVQGVYYKAIGSGNTMHVSAESDDFDPSVSVLRGPCKGEHLWGCHLFSRSSPRRSFLTQPGAEYFILVHQGGSDEGGSFRVSINERTPRSNDICETTEELKTSSVVKSSHSGATRDGYACDGLNGMSRFGLRYRVEGSGDVMEARVKTVSAPVATSRSEPSTEAKSGAGHQVYGLLLFEDCTTPG